MRPVRHTIQLWNEALIGQLSINCFDKSVGVSKEIIFIRFQKRVS